MQVSQIMRQPVITVDAKTPVKEIAKKLIQNDLTGMPVVKGDEVIGMVTEADLIMQRATIHMPTYISMLSSFLYLENPDNVSEELRKILGITAEEIMTKEVITIRDNTDVTDLATLFEDEHVNPVPVIDGKSRLVGIVSRADIVRLLARDV